ncbi:MAG TPA: GxxExxY protein [Usitatibacter sp.]|nr:GxxExxY protein [Usitatibacter sp.]
MSASIIGAAMRVHSALGPGLLEAAYEACLCHELHKGGISYERQLPVPFYDGVQVECGFRLDLIVEKKVVVEVKSVERLSSIHDSQLLTYLRLTRCRLGLSLNFNVSHLRHGIRRLVL